MNTELVVLVHRDASRLPSKRASTKKLSKSRVGKEVLG